MTEPTGTPCSATEKFKSANAMSPNRFTVRSGDIAFVKMTAKTLCHPSVLFFFPAAANTRINLLLVSQIAHQHFLCGALIASHKAILPTVRKLNQLKITCNQQVRLILFCSPSHAMCFLVLIRLLKLTEKSIVKRFIFLFASQNQQSGRIILTVFPEYSENEGKRAIYTA